MKLTSFDIIKKVRISEKGMRQTEKHNQYTFVADRRATAPEIKAAVQELFGVTVKRVNTCNMLGKERRKMTKAHGWSGDWKKAIVTLKEGEKIDLV
jgi:large subunit ribosomal protein L23